MSPYDNAHPDSYARAEPFTPDWPAPAPRLLRDEVPPAPALPLAEVFGPIWGDWIAKAAEAKSAPPDYVMAGLLAVAGAALGNTRWVRPWEDRMLAAGIDERIRRDLFGHALDRERYGKGASLADLQRLIQRVAL